MSTIEITEAPLQHSDSFFIGGEWVEPSSKRTIDVIDSTTEEENEEQVRKVLERLR